MRERVKETLRRWGFANPKEVLDVLLVPVVLALGGLLLTIGLNIQQEETEEQRAQDEALQAYQEGMESLILEEDLPSSEDDDEVRTSARARTLTILARVDAARQRDVVRFLYESQLIGYYRPALQRSNTSNTQTSNTQAIDIKPIVRLGDADLSSADLSSLLLRGAILSGVDLKDANLSDARLNRAYLGGADLSGATVT